MNSSLISKKLGMLVTVFLFSFNLYSQSHIEGFVQDASDGEALIFANVYDTISKTGTSTDKFGYFDLPFKAENAVLMVSYVGYQTQFFNLDKVNLKAVVAKLKRQNELNEVTVTAQKASSDITLGIERITSKNVAVLPVIMGEPDLIRTLTLSPGVSFGNEAVNGFFVRGSSADQNLILLDGAPVYNPFHLNGYFSVFNSLAVNQAELYKGYVPSEYGNRLASVLDIEIKKGNSEFWHSDLSFGNVAASFLLEGPIIKDRASILITARRSMLDLFNKDVQSMVSFFGGIHQASEMQDISRYYFFDYSAKINYRINSKHHVFLSYYESKDNNSGQTFGTLRNSQIWGNRLFSLRFNSNLSKGYNQNTILYYTRYKNISENRLYSDYHSDVYTDFENQYNNITEVGIKTSFSKHLSKHELSFGLHPEFRLIKNSLESSHLLSSNNSSPLSSVKTTVFLQDLMTINPHWNIESGIRMGIYHHENYWFGFVEPKLKIEFKPKSDFKMSLSYHKSTQDIHLLSQTWKGSPSDMWIPASEHAKPETAHQLAFGIGKKIKILNFTAESYYKKLNRLVEINEKATNGNEYDFANILSVGGGYAYGLEFGINKNSGRLTGAANYTWSKSERRFSDLYMGKTLPYVYDRRHQVNLNVSFALTERWNVSGQWIWATGQPIYMSVQQTFDPSGSNSIYYYDMPAYSGSARMPAYHRLDLGIAYKRNFKKLMLGFGTGVYNVYNRMNPYSLRTVEGSAGYNYLEVSYLMGVLPYISINVGFNSKNSK